MKTMKKFGKYLILFVLMFLFVSVMTYLGTYKSKNNLRSIEYVAEIDDKVEVNIENCKATNTKAYIKGNIINKTGKLISDKYIQISFYNNNNSFLGSDFKEIKYFNVNEKIPFEVMVSGNNIDKIVISIVDETVKEAYTSNPLNDLPSIKVETDSLLMLTFLFLILK